MYSKIIVPLDGSDLAEQALPYAELVAATLSAPIELVQAYDILPGSVLGSRSARIADQLQMGARERAEASLSSVRQRLEDAGFAVNIATQRGPAADVIVTQAGTDPGALVVMCTHGRGGISRWVMGSVTDKVLHTVPNPMLIVRATVTGPASPSSSLKTVVVPLDGSALSELAIPPRGQHGRRSVGPHHRPADYSHHRLLPTPTHGGHAGDGRHSRLRSRFTRGDGR